MRTRHTFVATIAIGVVAATGLTAAIAAGPNEAPPKIAFVARGDGSNFADALAVGSIAGQLGAPVFTTSSTTLEPAAAAGLDDYNPELVIITGGPVAISAEVEAAIETATGLAADKVVRAAGADRYATAVEIANILTDLDINTAFLAIDGKALDADTLDGIDSTGFLAADGKALDAAQADNADTVNGVTVTKILLQNLASGAVPEQTIYEGHGLIISGGCSAGLEDVFVQTTVDNSEITSTSKNTADAVFDFSDDDFDTGEKHEISTTTANNRIFNLVFHGGNGTVVTAQLSTEGAANDTCEIGGMVMAG